MKKVCFVLVLLYRSIVIAQTESPGQLPQLLPVTPEAAQLVKVGLGNINKSSGAVQASIPLYEITVKDIKLPITLNYLSQGNKVEELCSRVGYGWSLYAGGAVTRQVMGLPDERALRPPIPSSLLANTQEVLNYFEGGKVTNNLIGQFDTQPDEFYYSFNGHSGKFILNDEGTPEIITHENLKISLTKTPDDISIITIVTPDGVKYIFGGTAFEKTQSDGFYKGSIFPKTSFLLSRIELLTGDYIQFNYNHIQTKSQTGFSENVSTPKSIPNDGPNCPGGHFIESRKFSFQAITYDACYLTSIITSTGIVASFTYGSMPDISNDVRLNYFEVINSNGRKINSYFFDYVDYTEKINAYPTSPVTWTPGVNGRFFLTRLYQKHFKGDDGAQPEILAYDFDYYGNGSKQYQPDGNVFSQDHFGFANGKNNSSLLPQPGPPDNFDAGFSWGDRSPDWQYAVQGVLKKITFPTNGFEEFFYEPNTIMRMEVVPVPRTKTIIMHGEGTSPYGAINGSSSEYIAIQKNQEIKIFIRGYADNSCGAPCDICKALYCRLVDYTTGENLRSYTMQGLYPIDDVVSVVAGHTYQIKVDITGPSCFHANVQVNYDAGSPDPVPVNKVTGGIRVNRITKTDPVTGGTVNKFFRYAALESMSISSGQGFLTGVYQSESRTGNCIETVCYQCGHNNYTSNGIFNLNRFDNSHIYYTSIIESDDVAFANGGTEYTYYPPYFGSNGTIIRGAEVPFAPDGLSPNLNGILKRTKIFDHLRNPKQIEEDNYESVQSDKIVRSIYIRKNYNLESYVSPPDAVVFMPYDIRESNYAPRWVRLTSNKITEFSDPQHSLETLTTFVYSTIENVLPAAIITTNSKDEQIRIDKKYPTDFTNDPVLQAMKNNYNIEQVVEEYKYKVQDNTELERKKIIYKDWFNDTKVIAPWIIQQKKTGIVNATLEDRIQFMAYDNKGNVTEVAKAQGYPISYIWDYKQSLVSAQINNAHANQVAYTSFETNTGNSGGWNFSGLSTYFDWAPTGKAVFDLTGKSISKSALENIVYKVSYWSNSGPVNVNGTTATAGRQAKEYTYYEHTVSPTGNTITITGSGLIDELRLYPEKAEMITFTYEPQIGISSQCDEKNLVSFYEYDDLNRLLRIRDLDNNILQQFDYQYKVEINFDAQWQATGTTRCQPCTHNANYPNGYQEHEEKDMNINSPNYNQTRWINDGVAAACAIQADWQLTGNTKCEQEPVNPTNSGLLMHEEKDMNPCSSTYGNTRWWIYTMDCATCPKKANWERIEDVCEKDANNKNTGYHITTYKDMEPCSLTAGTTKTSRYYDPSGPCYVCTTGNCLASEHRKCINGVCEGAGTYCISSVYTKEIGVWKYKCTWQYRYSNCTSDGTYVTYQDSPCKINICVQ